jgi:solute carrier family 25 carnitine/acylcarnitine transporter 20/29
MTRTLKNEGIAGLYRGQTSMLLREIPGNFCWFGVYESVCKYNIPVGGTKEDLPLSGKKFGSSLHTLRSLDFNTLPF